MFVHICVHADFIILMICDLECVSKGVYTCSFPDRIDIPSDKTHDVTRRFQSLKSLQEEFWDTFQMKLDLVVEITKR